jgi:hypothetical protein
VVPATGDHVRRNVLGERDIAVPWRIVAKALAGPRRDPSQPLDRGLPRRLLFGQALGFAFGLRGTFGGFPLGGLNGAQLGTRGSRSRSQILRIALMLGM